MHFTVLIAGDDIEDQLAPFHEVGATGCTDGVTMEDEDVTEEVQEEFEDSIKNGTYKDLVDFLDNEYHGWIDSESKLDLEGKHLFSYVIAKEDKIIKAVRRYNPDARWDWYQEGGRWNDKFLMKDGTRSYKGRIEEIDFSGMIREQTAILTTQWNIYHNIAKNFKITYKTIEAIKEEVTKECLNISKAFEMSKDNQYHLLAINNEVQKRHRKQKAIKLLNLICNNPWHSEIDLITLPLEDYVAKYRSSQFSTFAFIDEGVWYEIDQEGASDYAVLFDKFIGSLDPETMITIVDCHI